MVRIIIKSGLAVVCLLAVSVFVPRANAASIDFSCGGTPTCTGTVTGSTSMGFSTTGIGVTSNFDGSDVFSVMFTTNSSGTGSISISDTDGDSLSGSIVATSVASSFGGDETLTFNVNWTTLSANVQTALGGATSGVGQSSVEFSVSNGAVNSADLHVNSGSGNGHSPTPEPSTLFLLGTGLLGVGFAFRRHVLA